MNSDINRLLSEVSMVVNTLHPETDAMKLSIRLEEVLTNYKIERKSFGEIVHDIPEKADIFLSAMKLEGSSEVTLKDYQMELRLFSEYMSKSIVQVSTPDIRSYLTSYKDAMASTIGKKLFVLRSFFGWLVKEEYLLRNPASKINPPKTPKRIPKGLSTEELEQVRESCTTNRQRAILELFYSSGCRLNELANMNLADINYQSMSMMVIGKGDKEREVYLSSKADYYLQKYLKERSDDCEALFATERKPYRRMSNATIQREVGKMEEQSKITKKLTCHVFRYTTATNMLEQGADLVDVQHILGHSDPKTTLIYGHVSEERKRQAHKRYHVQ